MITAQDALDRLIEGNQRFVSGIQERCPKETAESLNKLTEGQNPFAVILGCSDSRGPVEIIFDQGLGDLFVIRVAGNIARNSQIGSIEYAVTNLNVPLVVVLGHTHCGAVTACVDDTLRPMANLSPHVDLIVKTIRPSIEPVIQSLAKLDRNQLINQAVKANVHEVTKVLTRESEILNQYVLRKKLMILGAEYSLETGIVEFFD